MKLLLAVVLFLINLLIWGFVCYIFWGTPMYRTPIIIAFITFLICYFLLPKLFFKTDQQLFSMTTYDYIWAQLKWANGIGFSVGFIILVFFSEK